jgi:hypothetical protein
MIYSWFSLKIRELSLIFCLEELKAFKSLLSELSKLYNESLDF